jgi:hypothetical protein
MGELTVEGVESSKAASVHEASLCPVHGMHTQRASVEADDELVFPEAAGTVGSTVGVRPLTFRDVVQKC